MIRCNSQTTAQKLPFPEKVYQMLDIVDKGILVGESAGLSWLPDGDSFQISSPSSFCKLMMPKYFAHANYKSFTRQLYLYGFLKKTPAGASSSKTVCAGTKGDVFYHPEFVRDDRKSAISIRRRKVQEDRRLSRKRNRENLLKKGPILKSSSQAMGMKRERCDFEARYISSLHYSDNGGNLERIHPRLKSNHVRNDTALTFPMRSLSAASPAECQREGGGGTTSTDSYGAYQTEIPAGLLDCAWETFDRISAKLLLSPRRIEEMVRAPLGPAINIELPSKDS